MQNQPQPPDRILRIATVLERTGLTRSTLYRKMEAGTFPQNTRISTRCMGWRESLVTKWLRNLPPQRGPGTG
jgi:prophage regulatory protein